MPFVRFGNSSLPPSYGKVSSTKLYCAKSSLLFLLEKFVQSVITSLVLGRALITTCTRRLVMWLSYKECWFNIAEQNSFLVNPFPREKLRKFNTKIWCLSYERLMNAWKNYGINPHLFLFLHCRFCSDFYISLIWQSFSSSMWRLMW